MSHIKLEPCPCGARNKRHFNIPLYDPAGNFVAYGHKIICNGCKRHAEGTTINDASRAWNIMAKLTKRSEKDD